MLLARFGQQSAFPYCSPSYPTADQVIPFALFDVVVAGLVLQDGRDAHVYATAHAHGLAMAHANDKTQSTVDRQTKRLERAATPLVWLPRAAPLVTPEIEESHG